MDYKKIYNEVLEKICLKPYNEFDYIVEQPTPKFSDKLISNEKANANSLYKMKLNKNASEEDYKDFVEYIYAYIGIDYRDIINYFDPDDEENDYE